MTVRNDDDRPDHIEYDPRWEVQPEPDQDDDPGSNMRTVVIAAVAMTVFVSLLVWLVMNTPPGF